MKNILMSFWAVCGLTLSAAEIRVEMETGKSPTNGAQVQKLSSGAQIVRMTAKARPAAPDLQPDWSVTVHVPAAGKYLIKLQCYAAQSSNDSVFWNLNGGAERRCSCKAGQEPDLVKLGIWDLKLGDNTFHFRTREMGFGMDYLTLEPVTGKKSSKTAPAFRVTPGDLEAAKFRYDSKQVMADLRPEKHPCIF